MYTNQKIYYAFKSLSLIIIVREKKIVSVRGTICFTDDDESNCKLHVSGQGLYSDVFIRKYSRNDCGDFKW